MQFKILLFEPLFLVNVNAIGWIWANMRLFKTSTGLKSGSIVAIRMTHWRRRVTEGAEFWISCKRPAFLSSFSRSVTRRRQCDIRIPEKILLK